ncbi:hypothetical protein HanIR_Chr04g0206931 [Helianthus annuus]|nr:hypothetical protein HanIR_Chr04g0206931 [Helianthus annuus]
MCVCVCIKKKREDRHKRRGADGDDGAVPRGRCSDPSLALADPRTKPYRVVLAFDLKLK